jgi:hypothetical protein
MSPTALLPTAIPGLALLSAGVARAAASGLSFAATLADPGGSAPAASPAPSKSALPADLQKKLSQFAALLKERLGAMGTSLSGNVELSADVLGGMDVRGQQPDSQAVQDLFEQDQDLTSAFQQLAAAFNRALGRTSPATLSMPWDAAGAAQGVKMIVGENMAELDIKS